MAKKNKIYTKWTVDGINCKETNHDCSRCDIYLAYGYHKDNQIFKVCKMPQAIAYLEENNVPYVEPKERKYIKYVGFSI